ncbi:MAG: hypothetical protein K9M82_08375 [Deltaproteobacteria bacterium]|nr:hypothetical protein [Deltaproteobacteria bacterium]
MVNQEDCERVNDIILDYLSKVRQAAGDFQSGGSLWGKLRLVEEAVLFGRIVPGAHKGGRRLEED